MKYTVENNSVIEWAKNYKGEPFAALLCDPPYHLTSITDRFGKQGSAPAQYGKDGAFGRVSKGFMNSQWDGGDIAFRAETWAALAEHLYPGAFGMAFASSRGWHRMAVAIEDAGLLIHPTIFRVTTVEGETLFCYAEDIAALYEAGYLAADAPVQVRDVIGMIGWSFGSGFPKATNIASRIDKRAGATPKVVGTKRQAGAKFKQTQALIDNGGFNDPERMEYNVTAPATELAQAWKGHRYGGQVLKPAIEPIIVFQKPYDGDAISSMIATGAGALNVDGAKIGNEVTVTQKGVKFKGNGIYSKFGYAEERVNNGRWPANLVIEHVSLPVMRLKENLASEIDSFIRGYYYGYSRVSQLQSGNRSFTVKNQFGQEVLRRQMQERGCENKSNADKGNAEVRSMWNGISNPAGLDEERASKVLQSAMQEQAPTTDEGRTIETVRNETHNGDARQNIKNENRQPINTEGQGSSYVERGSSHESWVQDGSDRVTIEGMAGNGATDATESGLHYGASDRDGNENRQAIIEERNSSSFEWRENRQSKGELDSNGMGHTYQTTSDDRKGVIATERGKRTLEILACDIRAEWLGYFEHTGIDLGCVPVGTRRVKSSKGEADYTPIKTGAHHGDATRHETVVEYECVDGCPVRLIDEQSGESIARSGMKNTSTSPNPMSWGKPRSDSDKIIGFDDTVTAARFFFNADWQLDQLEQANPVLYVPKSSTAERDAGLYEMQVKMRADLTEEERLYVISELKSTGLL